MVCLSDDTVGALVAGRVPAADREPLEKHVADCKNCQQRLMKAALGGSPPPTFDGAATLRQNANLEDGDSELAPGEVVAGRYQVIRRIGDGGQSIVYEVHDVELDSHIALKALRGDSLKQEKLSREVQIARRLNHINVARVFDIVRDRGRVFVTMELIDGRSLAQVIYDRSVSAQDVLRWTEQMLDALVAIHAQNVLHRDLKPANVLIRRESRTAAIIDFGLARHIDVTPRPSSMIAGTPTYWAPELASGVAPSARSDLYALGRTVMELMAVADGELDPRLRAFVEKCLQPFEKDRFVSAREAQELLLAPIRKRRVYPWLIAAALGLAVVATAWVLRGRTSATPPSASTPRVVAHVDAAPPVVHEAAPSTPTSVPTVGVPEDVGTAARRSARSRNRIGRTAPIAAPETSSPPAPPNRTGGVPIIH